MRDGWSLRQAQVSACSNLTKDIRGRVFGKLTVISYSHVSKTGHTSWVCRCECGKTKIAKSKHLICGSTRSCGCLRSEIPGLKMEENGSFIHGDASGGKVSSEYVSWAGMIQRCEYEGHNRFERYGGRGIIVCDRWRNSFQNFLSDMGRKPGKEYSLDRINNDGNYEPGNCRWATRSEQSKNRKFGWKPKHRRGQPCTSTHRGVYWSSRKKRWLATIYVDGKPKYLGCSVREEEANSMVLNFLKQNEK